LIFESLNECPEDAMLSVKESTSNQMNIRIHPNPAINSIEIEIPKLNLKSLELKMIDETGNIVKSLKIISSNTTVNIADLAPGLYFCNFLGENNYYVEKIIKN